jgi:signal transduction histidine kinase/ActR/RegA family two-component response regulator
VEGHVFVLTPTGKDASLICSALADAGLPALACANVHEVGERAADGVDALVVAEEALAAPASLQQLAQLLQRQPTWSDLPMLLLTRKGRPLLRLDVIEALGNVTLIERPTQLVTLIRAVRTALRNRGRQYEMREADRRKDEFLAMLAHELRNPLAPIANAAHLLGSAELHEPRLKLSVGVLQRQARQLSRLVDDLLDVARISQGKITLQRAKHDLRSLVSAGVETGLPQIEAMGHQVEVLLPDEPLWVDADAVRIAQCVANLVTNAAKYTPPKGRIVVRLDDDAGQACIAVEDNGIGFDPAQAEHLFGLFEQVDTAQHRSQGGLGLGLAIVRSFAEMHDGTVSARSDGPGRGARFEIRLPLRSAGAGEAASSALAHDDDARVEPLAVLVVDDNQDATDSMAEILLALGHDVRKAYRGADALSALAGWIPQLAILDLGLPDMSGHELAQAILVRTAPARPRLIALTGWGQPADLERSRGAGFDHHLTKPADVHRLLAIIDELAARRAA